MDKKVYKYAFVGTHGSRKSSAATYLAALLKQKFPGKSVKVIEENVREISRLFYDKLNIPASQKLIFIDHMHKEMFAEQIYDIVVTDRACVCGLVYAMCYKISLPSEYFSMALNHMHTFDKVFFVRPDKDDKPYDDGFRDTRLDFRLEVDSEYEKFLGLWGGEYIEMRSSQVFTFPYLEKLEIV